MPSTNSFQRRLAFKAGLILFIAILLLIPLSMISGKISERESFQSQAEESIARSWTAAQQLSTPILVMPYDVKTGDKNTTTTVRQYRFIPLDFAEVRAEVLTTMRTKGVYAAPVYNTHIAIKGFIEQERIAVQLNTLGQTDGFIRHATPYIAVHTSDARGFSNTPTLQWRDLDIPVTPGSGLPALSSGFSAEITLASLETVARNNRLPLTIAFELRGMSSLQVIPASLDTRIRVQSNWPHPEFIGAFLPVDHTVSADGFSAEWRVNTFSSNIEQTLQHCASRHCKAFTALAFGTNFYQAVDIYLQTDRAIKYGILFIAVSFTALFMFEVIKRVPIHPVQYVFMGLSLAIFYLLLISLSEHLSFFISYLLSSFSCLTLLMVYLAKVMKSYRLSIRFSISLGVLYAVLLVIIQLEDFALLMGTLMLFSMLTVLMVSTRHIDWYALKQPNAQ